MSRILLHMIVAIAFMLTSAGAETGMKSRFEWKRPIEGTFTEGEQGRIAVTADVVGRTQNFPNDLRIFGEDGVQWPFFLHRVSDAQTDTYVAWSVLNKSFVSGDEPYLQFDLQRGSGNNMPQVHNQLDLHSSGRDFVRRVEVYSASGGQTGLLASGYLIDFSRQRDAENRIIRYPDSDVDRLHVRIFPNAQSADETFDLVAARMRYHADKETVRQPVEVRVLEVQKRDEVEGAQSFLYDLGEMNRPAEYVSFDIARDAYARCVSVYGRNTLKDPWVRVGGGGIHQLEGDTDHEIRIRAAHRFLKVSIFHYDDQPLDVQEIRFEALPRYLVFEAAGSGSAELYFTAWDIKAPRYDLAGRMDKEALMDLPVAPTLDAIPNTSAELQSWRKYSKLLAGVAVGVVSLLVVWVIVSMLRQQTLAGDQ